ncbi:MAG: PT domain-containing protein [Chloroflexota bacterium]|nr:PT domain-containing protein [Chloroflexota bacterium]
MRTFRLVPLLALPLLIVACSTSAIQPTIAPSGQPSAVPSAAPTTPAEVPTEAPTEEPSVEPTAAPTAEPTVPPTAEPSPEPTTGTGDLDPSLSDAGVVARVTLAGDSRGFDRDGTYDVIGVSGDGSGCSFTFAGDQYQAVAYDLTTDPGQVQRLSVTIPGTPSRRRTVTSRTWMDESHSTSTRKASSG